MKAASKLRFSLMTHFLVDSFLIMTNLLHPFALSLSKGDGVAHCSGRFPC